MTDAQLASVMRNGRPRESSALEAADSSGAFLESSPSPTGLGSLVFRGSGASRQRGLFRGWGKAEVLPSVILPDGEESSLESGDHFHCGLKLHGDLTSALVLQNCCGVE